MIQDTDAFILNRDTTITADDLRLYFGDVIDTSEWTFTIKKLKHVITVGIFYNQNHFEITANLSNTPTNATIYLSIAGCLETILERVQTWGEMKQYVQTYREYIIFRTNYPRPIDIYFEKYKPLLERVKLLEDEKYYAPNNPGYHTAELDFLDKFS